MRKKIYFIFFILLLVFLYLFVSWKVFLNTKITVTNFKVNKGDSVSKVIKELCSEKLINNCLYLKIYTKTNNFGTIKPGIYDFSGESLSGFFNQLSKGPRIKYNKFTILPGWTKFDIASYLENVSGKQIAKKFLNLVDDENYIQQLKKNYPILGKFGDIKSLEGFIYPDTYFFKKEDLSSILFPELLIKTAIKNFSNKWKKIYSDCKNNKNCNPYKLSNYEILILASIVEKEERNKKNKPYIGDILIRRYKNNWLIGTDWTLCYGLKVNSKDCKKYLFNKYLVDKSNLYNTRAVKGLPPTPVGNPSIDSIKAVLYPVKNNYWYYLHGKDGSIHFGRNSNEHSLNKQRYLK